MHDQALATPADEPRDAGAAPVSILAPPWRLTTIGMVALVAMIAFEALAVVAVMPTVVRELDGLALYAPAFGITVATSVVGMTVAGGWSDARGPAAPLWAGGAAFVAGLLLAGFAPGMGVFLAGRLVQGLGAGALTVALFVLVGRRYPEALRRRVFAAFATAWVVPSLAGPALAGLVAAHASWRWVFAGVAALALPAAAMLRPALRALPGLAAGGGFSRHRTLLAIGAAVGIGLLYAGARLPATLAPWLLLAAGGLVAACAARLLPAGTLAAARGLPSVIALRGLVCAAFYAVETFVPLQLAQQRGFSPAAAGLVLGLGALGWTLGSWYQGHSRNGWSRHRFLRVGTGFVLAGVVLTATLAWATVPVALPVFGWVATGAGMGLISSSLSVVVLAKSPPERQGTNASALQLSEAIGVASALALGGALFAALHATAPTAAYLANSTIAAVLAVLAVGVVARTETRAIFLH